MSSLKIDLVPFSTPNYVFGQMPPRPRQDGPIEAPKWHLTEVDAVVLAQLCDEFRADVFKKAGKPDPAASAEEPAPQ
jgi:hypothetical protein